MTAEGNFKNCIGKSWGKRGVSNDESDGKQQGKMMGKNKRDKRRMSREVTLGK